MFDLQIMSYLELCFLVEIDIYELLSVNCHRTAKFIFRWLVPRVFTGSMARA